MTCTACTYVCTYTTHPLILHQRELHYLVYLPVCFGSSVSRVVWSCPDHQRPTLWNWCSCTPQSQHWTLHMYHDTSGLLTLFLNIYVRNSVIILCTRHRHIMKYVSCALEQLQYASLHLFTYIHGLCQRTIWKGQWTYKAFVWKPWASAYQMILTQSTQTLHIDTYAFANQLC